MQRKTTSVFFDIAGAFDKVWHDGLIYKLNFMRVPYYLIKVIADFISNRTFKVKIENVFSDEKRINGSREFPQGEVLSPTMFSCYINDVPMANETHEKHYCSQTILHTTTVLITKNRQNYT